MGARLVLLSAAVLLAFAGTAAGAQTVDPSASVVHLRKTCDVDNCFTTTSALTTWLWGGGSGDRTNEPSSGDRVAVHVGPGEFGPLVCDGSSDDRGYISVSGSGRQQTRFVRTGNEPNNPGLEGACGGAIHVENCRELDFSHLTAEGQTGVFWVGGGEGTWSDVDMIGTPQEAICGLGSLGWYDLPGEGGLSEHFIFGSRAIARGDILNAAFDAAGAEIWFYGGDIVVEATRDDASTIVGVSSYQEADVRLFGTTVRAQVEPGVDTTPNRFYGAWAHDGGVLHMHGGIINASADQGTGNVDAYGIFANKSGSFAHSPGTAFVVKAGGSGTATRVDSVNGATVQSPFVWPAGSTPPAAASLHGSDAFVDTDAGSSGSEAHLMVRDSSCAAGGGPWRDMVTGSCRP